MGCEWRYDDVAKHDDAEYDDDSEHHANPTKHPPLPEREFERGVVHTNDWRLSLGAGAGNTRPQVDPQTPCRRPGRHRQARRSAESGDGSMT